MSSRKRKHGPPTGPTTGDLSDSGLLHIQAFEAGIRCNPTSAKSLEVNGLHIGDALISRSTLHDTEIWLDRCVRHSRIPSLQSPHTLDGN